MRDGLYEKRHFAIESQCTTSRLVMSVTHMHVALLVIVAHRYQSGGTCNYTECTEIRDIVFRNLTFQNSKFGK